MIFVYYLIATVFPIDKIIGRVYPIFGLILVFSAVGIFIAIFAKGYPLINVWDNWNTVGQFAADGGFDFGAYFGPNPFSGGHFIPLFFLTVACGILSGFHSTQTALISRTIQSEKAGRMTYYNMMVVEGFIAMCWAAGTMAMINLGASNGGVTMTLSDTGAWTYVTASGVVSATSVVGIICKNALGPVGGAIALIGVIILPITSGDTALRALRLTLSDSLHIKQENNKQRIGLAVPVFALVYLILIWAKNDPQGFNTLWRYFAWSNQMISLFALACITAWMYKNGKAKFVWIPLIPAAFYAFATCTFIVNAKIGLGFDWPIAYAVGAIFTVAYLVVCVLNGKKKAKEAA